MHSDNSSFNEKAVMRSLQLEFAKLSKLVGACSQVKAGDPDAIEKIEKALAAIPSGEVFGKALDELVGRARTFITDARRFRVQAFKATEAEFIRGIKTRGTPIVELDSSWRIGPLEFKVLREQSKVSFGYNHEVLIGWTPVATCEDIERLKDKADSMLHKSAIPEETLVRVFKNAYDEARRLRVKHKQPTPEYVPVWDFYREVRLALVRHELSDKKPDKKLQYTDLPRWAFLYNVDRYRALGSKIPPEERLGFQSGSQRMSSEGKGIVINGLDAREDHKVVCYVTTRV